MDEKGENVRRGRPILGSGASGSSGPSSMLSVNAAVFIPQQTGNQTLNRSIKKPEEHLKDIIETLKTNPAFYEQGLEDIAQRFSSDVKNEETLLCVVNVLVEECIASPNFRYTGARLCQAFSTDLNVGFPEGNFRQYLFKRVHAIHLEREHVIQSADCKSRVCGFMLYVGELFLHMRLQGPSKWERIGILHRAVLDLVTTCLNHPDDYTIKNVVQMLKLTGCAMLHFERETHNENKTPNLDGIFLRLKNLVLDEKFSRNTRESMLKLVEEHVNWHNVTEDNLQDSQDTPHQTAAQNTNHSIPFTNEPTFYSATGEVITAAEAGFASGYDDGYHSNVNQQIDTFAQGGGFDPTLDEFTDEDIEDFLQQEELDKEWDDEVASAFEEFLENQKNESTNRNGNWT